MNANASCNSSGCSDRAAPCNTLQFNALGKWPAVDTKSKYARTVPVNASAMPTEQINRYFQEASTEAFVRWSGIAIADTIVVASIATHISATFGVVTARSIARANALWKMRKRRAADESSRSDRSSPGPRADASSDTNAMHTAKSAESASTRQRSLAAAVRQRPDSNSPHSATLAANETPARPTLIHPTNRLYG